MGALIDLSFGKVGKELATVTHSDREHEFEPVGQERSVDVKRECEGCMVHRILTELGRPTDVHTSCVIRERSGVFGDTLTVVATTDRIERPSELEFQAEGCGVARRYETLLPTGITLEPWVARFAAAIDERFGHRQKE